MTQSIGPKETSQTQACPESDPPWIALPDLRVIELRTNMRYTR